MNLMTLECKCKKGHTWHLVIAKYWFAPECPTCKKAATEMRWGGTTTAEELQASKVSS